MGLALIVIGVFLSWILDWIHNDPAIHPEHKGMWDFVMLLITAMYLTPLFDFSTYLPGMLALAGGMLWGRLFFPTVTSTGLN